MAKRLSPSPDTVASKRKKREPSLRDVWDELIDDAESITGRIVYNEAITEDGVAAMRAAVAEDRRLRPYPLPTAARAEDSVAACGAKSTVVRAVIACLLSPGVKIEVSAVVQARLWATFPGGPDELSARLHSDEVNTRALVVETIKERGMQHKVMGYICDFLIEVQRIHGCDLAQVDYALEYLRARPDAPAYIEKELQRYKGVGTKIAALIAAFTCGAHKCAVDTNVHTLAGMLGWCDPHLTPQAMQKALNGLEASAPFVLPTQSPRRRNLRVALHCVLMQLGKKHQERDGRVRDLALRWAKRKGELQQEEGYGTII